MGDSFWHAAKSHYSMGIRFVEAISVHLDGHTLPLPHMFLRSMDILVHVTMERDERIRSLLHS